MWFTQNYVNSSDRKFLKWWLVAWCPTTTWNAQKSVLPGAIFGCISLLAVVVVVGAQPPPLATPVASYR